MKTDARMNVRCCCDPMRILGTLPAVDGMFYGHKVRFGDVVLELQRVRRVTQIAPSMEQYASPEVIATIRSQDFDELAFKSDRTNIEALRQIPGFQEV